MFPTLIFKTFWKHIHILCYHLGVSNHRILYWIWCIWKFDTGTVITFLFIHMVHGMDNYVACAKGFPPDTVISMRLPDSASIVTAEIWEIIKALEQIKDSVAS